MSSQSSLIVRTDSQRRQRALADRVDVAGFGLWTGLDVVYSFRPAPENSGIRFFRDDLPGSNPIPARAEYRIDKPRQTSLANGPAQVDMVEHVLAALRAARVDNCDVVVTAAEAPGMDGSSAAFLEAFLKTGTVEQNAEQPLLAVRESAVISDETFKNGAMLEIAPCESLLYEYRLIYDVPGDIPSQSATFDYSQTPDVFLREIGVCRTFLTLGEANELRKMGVCSRVTEKDALVFENRAPIGNELRYENECARHKLLDMTGDFALAPVDWLGSFRASKTGHHHNAVAVRRLLEEAGWK